MAKKKREQTTRRMPGGAQQYARPDSNSNRQSPIARRMDTIGAAMDDVRRTPRTLENAADRDAKQRMLLQAMIDESDTAQNARMMERQTTAEDRANRRKEGGAMKSKKSLAPTASKRPTPRPSTAEERAAAERAMRASRREQSEQDDVLRNGGRGMKAGGKVKKMAMGGKCRGMGAATRGGNFSRG